MALKRIRSAFHSKSLSLNMLCSCYSYLYILLFDSCLEDVLGIILLKVKWHFSYYNKYCIVSSVQHGFSFAPYFPQYLLNLHVQSGHGNIRNRNEEQGLITNEVHIYPNTYEGF